MKQLVILPLALGLISCSSNVQAPAPETSGKCDVPMTYNMAFNRFDETAQQITHATGCSIITDLNVTAAVKPNPVVGQFTPRQALIIAIKGTKLTLTRQTANAMTVE